MEVVVVILVVMVKFRSGGSDSGGNGKILIVVMMCEAGYQSKAGYQSNRVHSKLHRGIEIVEIPQKRAIWDPSKT